MANVVRKWRIPRRTFLRGLGTVIALPLLDAMAPVKLLASGVAGEKKALPRRMAFVYVPNGVNMAQWKPSAVGKDFELPYSLEPLKPLQNDLLVLSNLAQNQARSMGEGAGDHARASATFLTGCHPRKTQGADIRAGISVDQIAAARIGGQTPLPSLELGLDRSQQAGNCDSGYSCAYSYNISWRTESTPLPAEIDPRQVFERLFGGGRPGETEQEKSQRQRYEASVLDYALEDAKRLKRNLGYTDRHKLDEYLTAVRDTEQRIQGTEQFSAALTDYQKPTGIPHDFQQHARLMFDLMALAFQTDSTRVATFLVAHDGSDRRYNLEGIKDGHHTISHHTTDEAQQQLALINRMHVSEFAYFLNKLKAVQEGEGTLLDNCMIVYGSGISDGNKHNHDNLPILLAGRGGGTIATGRHLKFDRNTPLNNLYISMLNRMGVPAEKVGDSTGKLVELG